jgi:transcriptional regulator with XRE-family HTH domain
MTGGDLILMARRRAGLTQRELGERVGCRQATVARWEHGDREPSWGDVGAVAEACGLQLDAHLAGEDRSRWGDVAVAITLSPAERVRRVLAPEDDVFGPANVIPVLERLGESGEPAIVIGDVAGALHGWPLEISGRPVGVCVVAEGASSLVAGLGARPDTRWEMPGLAEVLAERGVVRTRKITEEPFVLPGGGSVLATETLPGTAGFADLARNAEPMAVGGRAVLVAGLLDLLRIADASMSDPAPSREDPDEHPYLVEERNRKSFWRQTNARYDALALRAVLDVRAAKQAAWEADDRGDAQKLKGWLRDMAKQYG